MYLLHISDLSRIYVWYFSGQEPFVATFYHLISQTPGGDRDTFSCYFRRRLRTRVECHSCLAPGVSAITVYKCGLERLASQSHASNGQRSLATISSESLLIVFILGTSAGRTFETSSRNGSPSRIAKCYIFRASRRASVDNPSVLLHRPTSPPLLQRSQQSTRAAART